MRAMLDKILLRRVDEALFVGADRTLWVLAPNGPLDRPIDPDDVEASETALVGYTTEDGAVEVAQPLVADDDGRFTAWFEMPVQADLFCPQDPDRCQRWTVGGAAPAASRAGRIVGLGASYTVANGARPGHDLSVLGYLTWAMLESDARLKYAGHVGVGGATAEEVRDDSLPAVLALDPPPRYCVVDAMTNNMGDVDLAGARGALLTILDELRAAGIEPVVANVPPRDGGSGAEYANIAATNAWLSRRAELDGFALADWYGALVDHASGEFAAGMLLPGDVTGLHASAAGAHAMGLAILEALAWDLDGRAAALATNDADPIDFIFAGCFTGGGGAGVPAGWAELSSTGGTAYTVLEDEDDEIVGQWFRVVQTGAGTTMVVLPLNFDLVPGHRVRWAGRFLAEDLAAGATTVNLFIGGAGAAQIGDAEATLLGWHSEDVSGAFELDFVVPVGVTTAYLVLSITGGAGAVQIAQQSLVDLTDIGAAT